MTITTPAPGDLRIDGSLTLPQRRLLTRLLIERVYDDHWYRLFVATSGRVDKRTATAHISFLLGLPKRPGMDPATDKQLGFIDRLMAEREIPAAERAALVKALEAGQVDRPGATKVIDALRLLPEVPQKLPFPEGYYALELPDGEPQRYRVTMVGLRVQVTLIFANERREHLPRGAAETLDVVDDIAQDWRASAAYYAEVTGRCTAPRCHRLLTDPASVARGMGPVCDGRRAAAWS